MGREAKIKVTELLPLKVYPFTLRRHSISSEYLESLEALIHWRNENNRLGLSKSVLDQ